MNRAMKPDCEELIVERHNMILSSISHDLKSPMNAIMGCVNVLLENPADISSEKSREFLGRVFTAGKEMLKLIEEILTMAKMEAGRESIEPVWIDSLGKELKEVVTTFKHETAAKDISLSLDTSGALPPVRWDARRIRLHVLNNIVSNALKFTPAGGVVRISASGDNGAVDIRVEDSGPGVPAEERQRIFQRFEHIDLKSARVFGGAGLGLSNARLFAERHGGSIYVEDSTDLGGACFVVSLPRDANSFLEEKTAARIDNGSFMEESI